MSIENIRRLIDSSRELRKKKNLQESLNTINDALVQFGENIEDKDLLSTLYFEKGMIYSSLESYNQAKSYYEKAFENTSDSTNNELSGSIQLRLATCYINLLEKQKACDSYTLAGKIFVNEGERFEKICYYTNANQYYSIAEKMFVLAGNLKKKTETVKMGIKMEIAYYKDLSTIANTHNYTNSFKIAKSFAWRALSTSIDILRRAVNEGINIIPIIEEIKPYFNFSKNALLRKKDDMTPVIELKLNELYKLFEELSDDIPDDPEDVDLWIETHREAFQFLFPQITPQFLILTTDGRLIHHTKAEEDFNYTIADEINNSLFAGVITAIRMAFQEEISPAHGLINEINAGGEILIFENTENFVIIAVVTIVYPEIRKFLNELANKLEENFSQIIKEWYGDDISIQPIKNLIDSEIKENFEY